MDVIQIVAVGSGPLLEADHLSELMNVCVGRIVTEQRAENKHQIWRFFWLSDLTVHLVRSNALDWLWSGKMRIMMFSSVDFPVYLKNHIQKNATQNCNRLCTILLSCLTVETNYVISISVGW